MALHVQCLVVDVDPHTTEHMGCALAASAIIFPQCWRQVGL